MQKNVTKEMYYSMLIARQIMEVFNEENTNSIDLKELNEGNNATAFIHAMSCAAAEVYQHLTSHKIDFLEFNHIANRLCFQFCKSKKENKDE